jgi:hypothetical protein
MVAVGGEWTHPLLRSAHEQPSAVNVPIQGRLALASGAVASQPKRPRILGSDAALDRSLASSCARISSFSSAPHGRHYGTIGPSDFQSIADVEDHGAVWVGAF